ncbi:hypothetical protein FFF34_018755 [Inquilinus sp. KBS0705]|nr:hypothetical protein FFF34_018755 [Inquilinus sp. KBS0705]
MMSANPNNTPAPNPPGDPKVNTTEKEVITNSDEAEKVVNQDDVVADMDGIEEALTPSDPSFDLNADKDITNSDKAGGSTDEVL